MIDSRLRLVGSSSFFESIVSSAVDDILSSSASFTPSDSDGSSTAVMTSSFSSMADSAIGSLSSSVVCCSASIVDVVSVSPSTNKEGGATSSSTAGSTDAGTGTVSALCVASSAARSIQSNMVDRKSSTVSTGLSKGVNKSKMVSFFVKARNKNPTGPIQATRAATMLLLASLLVAAEDVSLCWACCASNCKSATKSSSFNKDCRLSHSCVKLT
mmetsp:Transcript_26503/g.55433  ORF Transcript_26503/g.55433 Transcript_26503/m.55433 type:complete len:214 (-) Transcript_26503:229-870(-)